MNKIKEIFKNPFRDFLVLDLRALGLFRILLGLCLVIDFLDRLKDVEVFYSSNGVVFPSLFSGNVFWNNTFSVNFISGNVAFQTAILVIGLVVSIFFTLGYYSKISTILLWILVVSIQNLNGAILQGGDDYMRMLLFWGMFLPLGRRLSVDSIHIKFSSINRYFSIANFGLIFQIAFLYIFTSILKDSPIWTSEYSAVYYALSLDIFRMPIGDIVLNTRWLPPILTFMAITIEKVVGFMILFPIFNQVTRFIAVILILNLHIGIGSTMDVGPFSWVSIAAATSLFHTQWIDLGIQLFRNRVDIKFRSKGADLRNKLVSIVSKAPYISLIPVERKYTRKWIKTFNLVLAALVIFPLLTFVFICNMNTLGYKYNIGELPSKVVRFLRIDQNWKMFAPYPSFDGGWTVIYGYDESGKQYSLFRNNTLELEPVEMYKNPGNERWKKYTMNLWSKDRFEMERVYLLGYLCRQSQDGKLEGVPPLRELEFFHQAEISQPNYQPGIRVTNSLTSITCSR
jgi:hypothetical protein